MGILNGQAGRLDGTLLLATAMHNARGAYALLLGSGISRDAGILTGGEIVSDLVQKAANLTGESVSPDAVSWFQRKFEEPPTYSSLLDLLARTPAERGALLRGYFEPNAEELDSGQKVPTPAHRAVAELVRRGFVRIILTTNFDRLMEMALEAEGVTPTVIKHPDDIPGAPPVAHARCLLIKLNGDYLDSRLKNTEAELSAYDERMVKLIRRVFEEFGLVVCGWSAESDTALASHLAEPRDRPYTTWWTHLGEPRGRAAEVIAATGAVRIPIKGASFFFGTLLERVRSLEELAGAGGLTARTGAATVKRLVATPEHRIRLFDLLVGEVAAVRRLTGPDRFPVKGVSWSAEEMKRRVQEYERIMEPIVAMLAAGCRWGAREHIGIWGQVVERLGTPPRSDGNAGLLALRRYPALLSLYSGGVVATAGGRFDVLAALLQATHVGDEDDRKPVAAAVGLAPHKVFIGDSAKALREGRYTPLSDHVHDLLREPLQEYFTSEDAYSLGFDHFECFLSLAYADIKSQESARRAWAPPLAFAWRREGRFAEGSVLSDFERAASEAGSAWPPLQAGLFGGDIARFQAALRIVRATVKDVSFI